MLNGRHQIARILGIALLAGTLAFSTTACTPEEEAEDAIEEEAAEEVQEGEAVEDAIEDEAEQEIQEELDEATP